MQDKTLDFSFPFANITIDARIDYFNIVKNIKPASYFFHTHTMCEVYFIESGSLILQLNEDIINLDTWEILIICPNTEHKILSCSDDLKRFNFRFLFKNSNLPIKENTYTIYSPSKKIKRFIFENIEGIHENLNNISYPLSSYRLENSFGIIASYIAEQILPSKALRTKQFTQKQNSLTQYIKIDTFFSERYNEHITIYDLAEELNYSKNHTNRILKAYTKMTFSENLARVRINIAKKLLKQDLTIAEISERCGFQSSRGFELFFKNQTNQTPNQYRNMLKK